ncbi:MAG: Fe-S cluster biogenesis protein NfuA [Limisphaerales bacterium]|jgi:Fe-S cluster biogenesis protein NfuA
MNTLIDESLYARVEASLESIRPYLQKDGGDIELVEINDQMEVIVKLVGACETCPMSFMTMKAGVEANLKSAVPEITAIKAVNLT